MKLPNLLSRDFKIVERCKIWFMIPAAIVFVAIIFGVIWGVSAGSPFNLSMDFAGGYELKLELSTKLTDETFPSYKEQINTIADNLTDANGTVYGLTPSALVRQGQDDTASISIRYKAIRNVDMQQLNERFAAELNKLFENKPSLTFADGKYTAVYPSPIKEESDMNVIRKAASDNGITAVITRPAGDTTEKILIIETAASEADVLAFLTIPEPDSGSAEIGQSTAALIGAENLAIAILTIALALTLMLVYIAFRFEVSSGVAAVVALMHDLLIMFAAMTIFHIEIGITFIAAIVTILGYSINNTIIIFDRIREKIKPLKDQPYNSFNIANDAVHDTLWRTINTTITTLIPITLIVLIGFLGVPSIQIFGFPIIVGLLAGTYSSVFVSPSIWALWKRRLFTGKVKTETSVAAESNG